MTAVKENQDVYFASFDLLQKKLAAGEPSWLQAIRKAAIDRFAELGFPTTHNEEWKYTNVAPIARVPFQPVVGATPAALELERLPFADLECSRLVFVNGHYCPELSSLGVLPQGMKAGRLAEALAASRQKNGSTLLEEHLARYASFHNHPFVALNTAFMEDGALVEIPRDVVLPRPILLLFLATANGQPRSDRGQPPVVHPRNLILVGRGSQVSFIEGYVGLDVAPLPGARSEQPEKGIYFTNAVTEVVADEGAVIDYCKVQQEGDASFHLATLQVHLARSSNVTTHSIALGGALVREEINTVLDGEGAECLLDGLYVVSGTQHVDNRTVIDHAKPHCGSRELYKGVLDGHSSGVFNGKIIVRKDAQKTDSKQSNKNLLLSEDAVVNTKPQLEIYADDVKCTHGATIGQVDQEAIFYLRSRGIGLEEARSLLIQAFAKEILARIKFESLRPRLEEALLERLAKSSEGRRKQSSISGMHR
jgi:Fe-S cluster assembly protein SufD